MPHAPVVEGNDKVALFEEPVGEWCVVLLLDAHGRDDQYRRARYMHVAKGMRR